MNQLAEMFLLSSTIFFDHIYHGTGLPGGEALVSLGDLRTFFLSPTFERIRRTPLTWFDEHIKQTLGIDVFRQEFPIHAIQRFERDNVRLLVMRSELGDDIKSKAIRDFLGTSEFAITRVNSGNDTSYRDVYKKFCQETKLPEDYFSRIVYSRYFHYFYDPVTEEYLREKWCIR